MEKGFAISRDLRINQMIRVFDVRVVDEDGSQLGVMRTADALRLAQERGLDLVEVAPLASPPVARLLDFGQYKYELTKREKEAKRRQRSITFKEVRLKPKIGMGDFETKVRRAIEFLQDGDRVKVSVQFRGRELTHPQIGRDLLDKFAEEIKEHGVVERPPLLEGKSMHISVASVHKPKPHEPSPATAGKGHARAETPIASIAGEAAVDKETEPAAPAPRQPEAAQEAIPETGPAPAPARTTAHRVAPRTTEAPAEKTEAPARPAPRRAAPKPAAQTGAATSTDTPANSGAASTGKVN